MNGKKWKGEQRAEPGAKKREACGRHIPVPSIPPGPAAHHTHTHGSAWSTPTAVRPALGPPSRVPPRRRRTQPIGDGLCPPLSGQPMAACRDRKLFQPAGVSTDAQEVPAAGPGVLTGGAEGGPPVSEEGVVTAPGAREGCRGGAGALVWRLGAAPGGSSSEPGCLFSGHRHHEGPGGCGGAAHPACHRFPPPGLCPVGSLCPVGRSVCKAPGARFIGEES